MAHCGNCRCASGGMWLLSIAVGQQLPGITSHETLSHTCASTSPESIKPSTIYIWLFFSKNLCSTKFYEIKKSPLIDREKKSRSKQPPNNHLKLCEPFTGTQTPTNMNCNRNVCVSCTQTLFVSFGGLVSFFLTQQLRFMCFFLFRFVFQIEIENKAMKTENARL